MKINKLLKMSVVVLAGILSLGTFTGCSKSEDVIVMGTNATFPPFEEIQGNEIVGFDVDISKIIAEKLGKTLKVEDMEFNQLLGAVASGKVDFVAAGMTVDEERAKQVDFSDNYFVSKQVIIVKEDNDNIVEAEDLVDKKVGVQLGTTGDIFVSGYTSEENGGTIEVIQFDKGALAVAELSLGKIDAVVLDEEPAKKIVANYEGVKIIEAPFINENYALAVKKGNTELLEDINEILAEIQADGTYDALCEKYFGKTE